MKQEEEFVKESITKYLSTTGIIPEVLPGSEPPDYYVQLSSKVYPLEVTNAETLAYSDDGKPGKLRHSLAPFDAFYKEINTSPLVDNIDVPANKTIFIYTNLPITDWSNFKKVFIELLNKGYLTLVSELKKRFPDNIKRISVINQPNTGIPIKFAISAKNPEIDIAFQIRLLLNEIVEIKEKKMNKAGVVGDRWLGILNNYFFDDKNIWIQELQNLKIPHSFKRIFIVMINGDVLDVKYN